MNRAPAKLLHSSKHFRLAVKANTVASYKPPGGFSRSKITIFNICMQINEKLYRHYGLVATIEMWVILSGLRVVLSVVEG